MANRAGEKEQWLELVMAAMQRYQRPDDVENEDDLIESMTNVATGFADAVLDEADERYGGAGGKRKRNKSRRAAVEDDDDDEGDD